MNHDIRLVIYTVLNIKYIIYRDTNCYSVEFRVIGLKSSQIQNRLDK